MLATISYMLMHFAPLIFYMLVLIVVWRWGRHANLKLSAHRELKAIHGSWRTDETYVPVAGRWTYLYRAVDSAGVTVDSLLSETRDPTAAGR